MPEAKMTVKQELDALRGEVWRALEMEGPPPSSEEIAKAVRSAAIGDKLFATAQPEILRAEARTEVLEDFLDELWRALDEHPAVALLAELSDRVNVLRIDSDELAFAHETMNEVGAFYGFDARCRWTIEAMGELKRAIQARRNADELEVRAASIRVVREVRKAAEEHYAAHRAVSDVMKKEEGTLGVDYHLHGPGAAAHYAEALRELRKEVEDLKRNLHNLGNLFNGRAHDLQRAADAARDAMVVLRGQVQVIRDLADPLGDDL